MVAVALSCRARQSRHRRQNHLGYRRHPQQLSHLSGTPAALVSGSRRSGRDSSYPGATPTRLGCGEPGSLVGI